MNRIARILSTVSLSETLIEKAAAEGIVLTDIPFIDITHITDEHTTKEIARLAMTPVTAVFTSVNAVQAVAAIVNGAQPHWSIYCIGHATKRAASQYFRTADIKAVADDSLSLAKVIAANKVSEITFFCGDKRMSTLPDELKANGTVVNELTVYHTEERPIAITEHYDAILFFSPSAVNSFFGVNKIAGDVTLFAIGNTTAAALETKTNNKILVGTAPSKEQLLDDAIKYFQQASVIAAK